jgi:SAM-dependent methyltransferase
MINHNTATQSQVTTVNSSSTSGDTRDTSSNEAAINHLLRLRGDNTYLFTDSLDDRRRLTIQVKLYTPAFKESIARALAKSNGRLRQRLHDPQATFRVLDLGCGEGLYLPVLTECLREQGARARIELVGLDKDVVAVATGQDYLWKLGMNNAWLYTHDFTKPFSQFTAQGRALGKFDLAYTSVVLMHLPGAVLPPVLQAIRGELLLPDGVFFSKDMSWVTDTHYPSRIFIQMRDLMAQTMLKLTGGVDFASSHHEFLEAAGFSEIESFHDSHPIGGPSEAGRMMLNNILLAQYAVRMAWVKAGFFTEQAFDQMLSQEFKEISPEIEGKITLRNTIAVA